MIHAYKYNADFYLVRNGFKFRRCSETNELIWPYQKVYKGIEKLRWPLDIYWLTPAQYILLKLKNEVA